MYRAQQDPDDIQSIADFNTSIYRIVPMDSNPQAADYTMVVGVERSTDTYVILVNSSFNGVYFMDKNKNISTGTVQWSQSAATLLITNAGLTSPVSYVRYLI